ncbi:hypothetical protein ABSA28_00023 [Candidatus Hepatincolaceae symbiont of Richtersius coronifer]
MKDERKDYLEKQTTTITPEKEVHESEIKSTNQESIDKEKSLFKVEKQLQETQSDMKSQERDYKEKLEREQREYKEKLDKEQREFKEKIEKEQIMKKAEKQVYEGEIDMVNKERKLDEKARDLDQKEREIKLMAAAKAKGAIIVIQIAATLILFAVTFVQFFYKTLPIDLAVVQRLAWVILLLITFIAPSKILMVLVLLANGLVSLYQLGREFGWVDTGCNKAQELVGGVIDACTVADFTVFGLSLAAYNLIASVILLLYINKVYKK